LGRIPLLDKKTKQQMSIKTLKVNNDVSSAMIHVTEAQNKQHSKSNRDYNIQQQVEDLQHMQSRARAKLENLGVKVSENGHTFVSGKNDLSLYAGIPKYIEILNL